MNTKEPTTRELTTREPTTYVANVRVSIKHLASIALFYNSQNEHKGTLSKLASAIIISGAKMTMKNFPVETITEAVEILQNLNYEDLYKPTAKHNKSLFRALGIEGEQRARQDSNIAIIGNIMDNKTKVSLPTVEAVETLMVKTPEEIPGKIYDLNKVSKVPMTAEEAAELTKKETEDSKSHRKAMTLGTAEISKA